MSHHSQHSGYDQLASYIECRVVEPDSFYRFLDCCPERILAQLRRTAGSWYNSLALKKELQLIPHYIFKSNQVYHFLYGEDSYHYSGYFNFRKNNKIVVTYHHPPEKYDRIIPNKDHLKKIDAVIVLCSQQIDYFNRWVEREKIHLILHGIDINYFHPIKIDKKTAERYCLFVGVHLRNFGVLEEVISKVNCINNNIHFTIVTDKEYFNKLSGLKNTRLLEKISEVELLKLYRESDVLLLPIIGCTANNTVLEAMACGLPIITNNVGGVKDYLDNKCAIFIEPDNADSMVTQLLKLLYKDGLRIEMSLAARQKALQYNWKVIAARMKEVYYSLFN